MNKIKPIYLFTVLVFIVIFVVIVFFSLIKGVAKPAIGPETTKIQPSPTTTLLPTLPPGSKTIKIIRSYPVQSPDLFYLTIQPIELMFTGIVEPGSLKYTIDPFVETEVKQGSIPSSLIISPEKAWKDGTTKITITSETISTDGVLLYPPFVFELNTSSPSIPEGDENY